MLQPDTKVTLELTVTEFNMLCTLADPAFKTVALIMGLRSQIERQDEATNPPPPQPGNGLDVTSPQVPANFQPVRA